MVVVALLGVGLSLAVSWSLSRSVLRGEASAFSLELPPYRPPRVLQTLYTSLIDRTMFVLWRAVVFAVPAGVVIWLVANVTIGGITLAEHFIDWSNPFGLLLGLNGVILLAYIIAIPANEIVIPTVLMLTVLDEHAERRRCGGGGDVRSGFDDGDRGDPPGRRVDLVDRDQPDAVQSPAQSVFHDHFHDLQRDPERQVDGGGDPSPSRDGVRDLLRRGADLAYAGRRLTSVLGVF